MNCRLRRALPVLLSGLLLWFLLDAQPLREAAREGLSLCAGTVIPSLLPFLVVSDLLLTLGLGQLLSPLFSPLMGLCHLPGQAGSALLLGLVGGYPAGAAAAAGLYRSGALTKPEAERLLTFCNNANPVFFLSVLGQGVFHSGRVGLLLWLIHVHAALLTGLLLRGGQQEKRPPAPPLPRTEVSFFAALAGALRRSGSAMVSLCACVVFFYVLLTPLRQQGSFAATLALGLTELFSLVPRLTPDRSGFLLAAVCSGWGGVSVLCQSAAVLEDSGLPLCPLVLGKLCQALLSLALALLLLPLLS